MCAEIAGARFPRTVCAALAVVLVVLIIGCAAGDDIAPAHRAAVEEVRAAVMALDPHSASRKAAAVESADSVRELRAWHLVAEARTDAAPEAEERARAMLEADDSDPWGWFALAAALMEQRDRQQEALRASESAYAIAPGHPDVLWMHAQALIAADDYEGALELIAEHVDGLDDPVPLIHQKSRALYYLAYQGEGIDGDRQEESRATAAEARTLDPEFAAAWFGEGTVHFARRRHDEALEPLATAADLSPGSITIQGRLGQAIAASGLSAEEKRARVEARVEALLAAHPDSPAALRAASNMWQSIGAEERQAALEAQILERHPDSPAAEWLAVSRYREVADEIRAARQDGGQADPEVVAEYERLLRDFIARPHHHRPTLKGDAFRSLFSQKAGDTDPEDLLWIVRGMVEYEGINPHVAFAQGAAALAEHTDFHDEAEEIARRGIEEGRAKIESQRGRYDNDGEYERALQWMGGIMYDALGWVLFQAGRHEEAEAELLRAYDSDPKNRQNLYHLGQLYEEIDRIDEAERFYVQGLAAQAPGENPNRAALAELYERRTGSPDGFDAYVAELESREAETRHREILAERIEDPEPVPVFELETLDGATLSSSDLDGQITVINFWGIWCGWCVIEMPELQQLHDRYADDPEVRVLTINNDDDPDDVPPWMEENGYAFPVLLDDGYVATDAGVSAFPTTWFLDRDGRMAFVKRGWSQELLQEFTWRIEALRDGSATAGR